MVTMEIPDDLLAFEQFIQLEKAIPVSEKPESGLEALCMATEDLANSSAKNGIIIRCSEVGVYDLEILYQRGQNYSSRV